MGEYVFEGQVGSQLGRDVTPHILRRPLLKTGDGGVKKLTIEKRGTWKGPKMVGCQAHLSQEHLADTIKKRIPLRYSLHAKGKSN